MYRWCYRFGGGLVKAESMHDAEEKLLRANSNFAEDLTIWMWEDDDYYMDEHPDVYDIYG